MSLATDDPLAHQFLVQRISVAVQRGNVAAVLGERTHLSLFFCVCLVWFVVVHLFLCSLIVLCCRFFIIRFLFLKLFLSSLYRLTLHFVFLSPLFLF